MSALVLLLTKHVSKMFFVGARSDQPNNTDTITGPRGVHINYVQPLHTTSFCNFMANFHFQ